MSFDLLVEVADQAEAQIEEPAVSQVEPVLNYATPEAGALRITVKAPDAAIGYHVQVDGRPMEPWQVEPPHQAKGRPDTIILEDLAPDKEVTVRVAAVDAAGNLSDWVEKKGRTSPKVIVPDLPKSPFQPKPGDPPRVGDLAVWAFPEIVEVDPVSARPLFEALKGDYKRANPVWSGQDGRIRIAAARGEIAGFQLALENRGRPTQAHIVVELNEPDGEPLEKAANLYRV